MRQYHARLSVLPYLPWCCLVSLPILFSSSLVFLHPVADVAGMLVILSWCFAGLQLARLPGGQALPRSMGFSFSACVLATVFHFGVLAVTGQDCVVTKGLNYLYWQAFISPDAPFACLWCIP